MAVLDKIAELTDEQLAEGTELLDRAQTQTDDIRFYHATMLMEQDRRRGNDTKGDKPGHPFRGNQWSGGSGGYSVGSTGADDYGVAAAMDVLTGKQPPNAASSVRSIDQSSVKSDNKLDKGGVNVSRVVEIEDADGTVNKYCFKPDDGEDPRVHPAYQGHQSTNEVAASVVDEAMGLDMVAKTEMAEIGGKKGSLQKWINDNAEKAGDMVEWDEQGNKTVDRLAGAEGTSDMMYFDALIGNTDRHMGNYLVKDNKIKLIDNGMSMADNQEYGDPALRYRTLEHADRATRMMTKMSPKFKGSLDKLMSNREETDAKLAAAGVGPAQRRSFWKRAEYLKRAQMLGFGDSLMRDLGRLAEGKQLF